MTATVWLDDRDYFDADGVLTAEDFHQAVIRHGRNDAPALLHDLVLREKIDLDATPGLVASAWCAAEKPRDLLPVDLWVEFFSKAGYTHDGVRAEKPSEPLRLYRGATSKLRRHMAWTTDLDIADSFAFDNLRGRERGVVYTALVPPEALLAFIGAEIGRGESEYVVSPSLLPRVRVYRTHREGEEL